MAPAVRKTGSEGPVCLRGFTSSRPNPDPRIRRTRVTTMATNPPAKAKPQEKRKPVFSSATTTVSVIAGSLERLRRPVLRVAGDQPENDDDRDGNTNQPQQARAHETPGKKAPTATLA